MKHVSLILIAVFLSACSVKEHNKKYLAQKAIEIKTLQQKALEDPKAKVKNFDDYIQVTVSNNNEYFELYFVKEEHFAYPTVIIRDYPQKKNASYWSWESSVNDVFFNQWFEDFWYSKFPEDKLSACPLPEKKVSCYRFNNQSYPHLYRQSFIKLKFESLEQCKCKL